VSVADRPAGVAIVGTGLAFAFLQAGAFTNLGAGTLQRMVAPAGLRAAALGAGVTVLLLAPVLIWERWRAQRARDADEECHM
jgi:hypothetical protein